MLDIYEKANSIQRLIKKTFHLYTTMFLKKDENLWIFGSWFGEKYADNPKYLFDYCLLQGINAVWFTRSQQVFDDLKSKNKPVVMAGTEEANKIAARAKYNIICTNELDTDDIHTGGSVHINLWHGIPIKKIGYDDMVSNNINTTKERIKKAIYHFPKQKTFYFSTSDTVSKIYQGCFQMPPNHIIQVGQARNDCFFDGSLSRIKYSNLDYSKMILYMPTHRNEGKTLINIEKIYDLSILNKFCSENGILFVIKKHFYHKDEFIDLSLYSNIIDLTNTIVDTQELLFNADLLITDYSSCYIDYMLLDRPIVFYCYDYDKYLVEDRELYFNYEEVAPGDIVQTFNELLVTLQNSMSEDMKINERYQKVKEIFYSRENQGRVCPRLVEVIKTLK